MQGLVRAVFATLALVGCGSSPSTPTYKGVLWLSWTISGQAVSDSVCAGIDHLVITVESSPSVGVAIKPVACTDGGSWERDDVPEGTDTVVVDAVDGASQTIFERVSTIGVTGSRPALPALVDLQPL